MILISFIIPVYNCEKYIGCALRSIYQKEIPTDKFEVIVVNDGSTDGTERILSTYTKEHSNLKYFTVENSGAGFARNVGLKQASGKYIQFVDADDYLANCNCGKLFDFLKQTDADIINLRMFDNVNDRNNELQVDPNDVDLEGMEYLTGVEHIIRHSTQSSPVKYIFRKDFLMDNRLYFSEIMGGGEDIDHTIYAFYKASSTVYIPWGWYVVRPVEGSLTRSSSLILEHNICEIVLSVLGFFQNERIFNDDSRFRECIISYLLVLLRMQETKLVLVPRVKVLSFYIETQQYIKEIAKILPSSIAPKYRQTVLNIKIRAFSSYLAFVVNLLMRVYRNFNLYLTPVK